jgi:toxin CcdB
MGQFDVYRNTSAETGGAIPYLLDVQADLLERLATRVVVPLIDMGDMGERAATLNPQFEIEGRDVVMSTAELAGVPLRTLGGKVASLAAHRHEIIAALDFLFTGI